MFATGGDDRCIQTAQTLRKRKNELNEQSGISHSTVICGEIA